MYQMKRYIATPKLDLHPCIRVSLVSRVK